MRYVTWTDWCLYCHFDLAIYKGVAILQYKTGQDTWNTKQTYGDHIAWI